MAYATLLHFMTQFSKRSILSLGGAPFVWHVRFGTFGYVWILFWELLWLGCNGVVNFFFFLGIGCMSILGLVLKFGRRLMVFILDFSVSFPNIVCQRPQGILWKFGICWLTSWLLLMWVSLFLWGVFNVWLWFGLLLIFRVLCDFL